MFMSERMSKEEFEGNLKKFGLSGISSACHIVLMKTGAVLRPDSVRSHLERQQYLSPAYTAIFRMIFKELEKRHESD
jgi:hypothetical protein